MTDTQTASSNLWTTLLSDFSSGQVNVQQVNDVIKAVTTAIQDVNQFKSSSIFQSVQQNFPQVLQTIEGLVGKIDLSTLTSVLGVAGPVGGAIGLALSLMAMSHGMPVGSEEEKHWFDRASGGPSANLG
jgi:hypothetical protein